MRRLYLSIITLCLSLNFVVAQELAMVEVDGKIGYINTKGEFIIQPSFEHAQSFSGPYAGAEKNDKWGFINTKGEWVIEAEYSRVKPFHAGVALVEKEDKWFYINAENKQLEMPHTDKFYGFNDLGVAFIRKGDSVGLMNTKGEIVVQPIYQTIKSFVNGYARVQKGEKWGIINAKGEVVVPIVYDDLGNYSKNGVWVRKNETLGVFYNGAFVAVEGAQEIWDYTNNSKLTYAKKGDKIGFINNAGKWIIDPKFEKARAFNAGLAPVYQDKKWGYVNTKGEIVIDFQYRDAEVFADNGLAPVKEKKDWGFINTKGELVIPMEYEISFGGLFALFQGASDKGFQSNGLARVGHKKSVGFINAKGEVIGDWYDNAELFVQTGE